MGIFNWLFKKTKKVSKHTSDSENDNQENSFSDGLDKLIKENKIFNNNTSVYDLPPAQQKVIFGVWLDRNNKGIKYEKQGEIDLAIKFYEQNISENYVGNHPYDRLAIIYRKQKDYLNEIRVLNKVISVFSLLLISNPRADIKPKIAKFKNRLEKATILLNKNEKR